MSTTLDYFRKDTLPHIWCPGCGHGTVTGALVRAIQRLGLDKDKVCVVSGIGCSSRAVGYLDFDSEPNLPVTVRMPTCPGSRKGIADTAITAWGYVYASLSGYVTGAAGTGLFSALAITLGLAAAPSGATVAAVGLGAVFEFVPMEDCPGW